jgi:septal ring factor EnvC (AmiA/AmiB activator)
MNHTQDETTPSDGIAALRTEIERLERVEDTLEEARGDFDHELRRVCDALIRAGGRSLELDAKAAQLRKNIKLSEKDLQNNRARQRSLRSQLNDAEQSP